MIVRVNDYIPQSCCKLCEALGLGEHSQARPNPNLHPRDFVLEPLTDLETR